MELTIRHAEPQDFEAVRDIYACPNATAGTLQIPFPSVEMWKKRMAEPPTNARALVASADGRLIGHLSLEPMTRPRRAHVAAIGMAVHDEFRRRGVGTTLLAAATELADNWLNLLRLELSVYTDNEPALQLYRRAGFVVEGTHRAYALRNGAYVDAFSMARLHPRPPLLPQTRAGSG